MTRPRKQPIELTASAEDIEELKEKVSRRRLMQLAGAGGASFVAGCGGGGGEASPTATETATEAPGQDTPTATQAEGMDTPTATQAEGMDTPTETETETMETPSGQQIEVVDYDFRKLTQGNFEQFTPQPWNSENAFQSPYQTTPLADIPKNLSVPSDIDLTTTVILQGVARQMELDIENNVVSVQLQDDPPVSFADGTVCNVDQVFAHWDLVQGQIELGEASESTLPLSWEADDEFSFTATLLPGNAQIRLFEAFFSGDLIRISDTHPKLHSEWIEGVRNATTTSELQSVYQDLFGARFEKSKLPDMSNGPFVPSKWNPREIRMEVRDDYPWGLGFSEVDKMYQGVKVTNVGAAQARRQRSANIINATVNNKQDHFTFTIPRTKQRFPDNWKFWSSTTAQGWAIWYQPHEPFGAKTERARKLRKGATCLFDNGEIAAIEDLIPGYEQSMGFWRKVDYQNWLGDVEDQYEDFGDRDSGYVKEQKGNRYFREAGYAKNKDGFWVDQESGEVLSAEIILGLGMGGLQLTQPILRNVPEQFNDMGIKATGRMVGGEEYGQAVANAEGDIVTAGGNCEMHPHPYFGYREDCGLGSTKGLPVSLWFGDWHNNYRRVKVPFPIGSVDGSLGTYDYDKNVLEIAQLPPEEIPPRVQELSWVLNQWVPGIFALQYSVQLALNTDRVEPKAPFSDPTASNPIEPGVERPADLWVPGGLDPRNERNMLALGVLGPP